MQAATDGRERAMSNPVAETENRSPGPRLTSLEHLKAMENSLVDSVDPLKLKK